MSLFSCRINRGFGAVAARRHKTYADELQPEDVKAYLNELTCAAQTRFKHYKRLRAWFRFIGSAKSLYSSDLKPTFTQQNPRIYTREQIAALLAHANECEEVALRLGDQCGFRKQENEFAACRDVDWNGKTIFVRDKRWSDIYPPERAQKVQEQVKAKIAEAEKTGKIVSLDPVWAFRVAARWARSEMQR
jgi:integrase